MVDAPSELPLRAGPPPTSPPLPIALMIASLGIIGPILFVRVAVPSPFLSIAALLLPIAGIIALFGSVESLRRRHADRTVRTRAVIGKEGILLLSRPGESEHHPWSGIAAAHATKSSLTLHLKGETGKRTRRAIRYGGLETPVDLIESRIRAGLASSRETVMES
ncbi:hypothetical protein AiwAL_13260 [Acidiphilium sp. AL]|uniref:Uncharacterized protein n=1 Tax=Acidiphilium iwatense TaxID=768198 RepID=A0ABS9DXM3_9PROT|nr:MULTISPECIES: hypothetical protein [Acidiphilium]MCF3946878.1 hypothetical protein [Acidiphilium iwatense]MCU4161063.1 hypothetical protein [Acidiphilium sp. AL]